MSHRRMPNEGVSCGKLRGGVGVFSLVLRIENSVWLDGWNDLFRQIMLKYGVLL